MTDVVFNEYGTFTDGEIEVSVRWKNPADDKNGFAPYYDFAIRCPGETVQAGSVTLRLGNTENIVKYVGHIGYGIHEKYRGRHYAAKACRLIVPVALDHDLTTLWITVNPDNWPSRRTCELLGCKLVDIVDIPQDHPMYQRGERQKCRYRWDIG